MCINKEDMRINGDWDSNSARLIDLKLAKCHGHSYCKTDEEITDFMKDKFLLLLYNKIRFDGNLYGQEAFVEESKL